MIAALLPWIAFLGAGLILSIPARHLKALRTVTIFATGICLAAVMYLFLKWDYSIAGFQFVRSCSFFAEAGIVYQTGLDGTGLIFCLLTGLVSFAAAFTAMRSETRLKEYLFFFLLLTGCMFAVFTVLNLFFLYVFYEMTLIPVFAMTGIAGIRAKKEGAAIRLALYMTAGAIIGLFALLHLYDILGPGFLDLTQAANVLAAHGARLELETQKWLAAFLIVGFGVMTTLFPLHSWSPAFYTASPVSLAMVHAGVKAGPYILLRTVVTYLPAGMQFWAPWLAGLALAGILYGGLAAIRQKNLRDIAAFSSISHMGTVFAAFAAFNSASLSAGLFLVFAHGLMTAAFFAVIDALESRAKTDDVQAFGGLGKTMPFLAVGFMLTAMASSGIPGFANFPAEIMVFVSVWKSFPWTVAAGILGVLFTAVYMFRAVHAVCFGEPHAASEHRDLDSFGEKLPFFVLLISLIVFGVFPDLILKIIRPAIEALI